MLQLRPHCECCNRDLAPASLDARICSFECTFCAACADNHLHGHCPNCAGELVRRPVRPSAQLRPHPASTARRLNPQGCGSASSATATEGRL